MSQTMTNHRQHLIEQLRQEEASEDTEHVIDWLEDSWATFDMLKERFGETRALQLYTADPSPTAEPQAEHDRLLQTCLSRHDERRQGAFYADAT